MSTNIEKDCVGCRNMKQSYRILLLLPLMLMGLSSCKHRVFERPMEQANLIVKFDWRYAPVAHPEQMSLFLFPINGDRSGNATIAPLRYDFAGRDGGTIKVAPGKYRVIALNSDVRGTYMRGERYEDFMVTTNENASLLVHFNIGTIRALKTPRAEGTEEEKVVEVPDIIYSDRSEMVEVLSLQVGDMPQELVLYPRKTTTTIEVEVQKVENSLHVVGYGASLTGLSNSIMLSGPTSSKTQVTVPFSGKKEGEGMTAKLETFGASRTLSNPKHMLVVYAIFNNGQSFYEAFDVTNQVQSAPDPFHIKITIPLVKLPKPIVSGSGSVTVTEWKEVEVPIDMG